MEYPDAHICEWYLQMQNKLSPDWYEEVGESSLKRNKSRLDWAGVLSCISYFMGKGKKLYGKADDSDFNVKKISETKQA